MAGGLPREPQDISSDQPPPKVGGSEDKETERGKSRGEGIIGGPARQH